MLPKEIRYTFVMKSYKINPVLILLISLFVLLSSLSAQEPKYYPWIEIQIKLIAKSNDANLSEEALTSLVQEREKYYAKAINAILLDRSLLEQYAKAYEKKVFTLKKMIRINKRRGNKDAALRDEVRLKSYRLLLIQNRMIQQIFRALDTQRIDTFEKQMHTIIAQSQKEVNALDDHHDLYMAQLKRPATSKIVKALQENIREFYALKEIHFDIIRYLSENMKTLYRLNRYSRYKLLRPALYLDNHPSLYTINRWLSPYGLSCVKIVLILFVSLVILFIRKVLLGLIERIMMNIRFVGRYAKEIQDDIRAPISWLLLVVNMEIIVYIYHDFSTTEVSSRLFNILYTVFLTFIIFRTLNSIARVKLENIDTGKRKIKSELFNLTVKIINFIIIIIGLLFVLHFAGVNLTAVLSGLGIGGFAVALAARESLSNFFGTLSILMSEIFSQGDWIEADGKEGNVVEIGLRVTTIRTFDNALIAIPNATLASKEVKNWSKRIIGRRIKMRLALRYDSPPEALQQAVEEIRDMLQHHPDIATDRTVYQDQRKKSAKIVSKEDELGVKRTLMVHLDRFSDSSIDILIYAFTKSTVWGEWMVTKEDVMYRIMEILKRHGLSFAFPTVTIDQDDDSTLEKKI